MPVTGVLALVSIAQDAIDAEQLPVREAKRLNLLAMLQAQGLGSWRFLRHQATPHRVVRHFLDEFHWAGVFTFQFFTLMEVARHQSRLSLLKQGHVVFSGVTLVLGLMRNFWRLVLSGWVCIFKTLKVFEDLSFVWEKHGWLGWGVCRVKFVHSGRWGRRSYLRQRYVQVQVKAIASIWSLIDLFYWGLDHFGLWKLFSGYVLHLQIVSFFAEKASCREFQKSNYIEPFLVAWSAW